MISSLASGRARGQATSGARRRARHRARPAVGDDRSPGPGARAAPPPRPRPTSPAPTTTTFWPASGPRRSSASSTAACETEAVPRPIAVSLRARLPTSTARRKRRFEVLRVAPSSLGEGPRRSDLAEDLGLPDHGRADARRHLEQVGGRLFLVLAARGEGGAPPGPARRASRRSRGCRRRRRGSAPSTA